MFCYHTVKNTLEKHCNFHRASIFIRGIARKVMREHPSTKDSRVYRVRRIGPAAPKIRINQRQGKHITAVRDGDIAVG